MKSMMRMARLLVAAWLALAAATPAYADGLRAAAEKAAQQAAPTMTTEPRSNVMKWTGLGLFVGGMSVGLYSFIHNKNGSYSEFGEADAVNKKLGAASLAAAFAGGALLFVGTRKVPVAVADVKVGPSGVSVTKQLSW
jgi:hypothetical protein